MESLQILIRVAQVLIEGMGQHAVICDQEHYERFSSGLVDLACRFSERMSGSDCLVHAGAAVRSLEDYTRQASAAIQSTRRELDAVVTMLTRTVAATAAAGCDSVRRLQQIEGELTEAKSLTDMRVLKSRLEDCLSSVRTETRDRQRQVQEAAAELAAQGAHRSPASAALIPSAAAPCVDAPAGCSGRKEAEMSLSGMCAAGKGFVAILTLERLQIYNARYGRAVGDDVLRFFGQKLREIAPQHFQVHRWSGPTMLILTQRTMPPDEARAEIKRIHDKLPPYEAEFDTRSASLSLSCRSAVFPTVESLTALIRKIEMFAAVQAAHTTTELHAAINE